MSRFRGSVLLILAFALAAFLMPAAVPSVAQTLPSSIKRIVLIGPNSTKSLTVRGTVTLRPLAPPTAGVTSVVFYLDGNGIGTVKTSPFTMDWDSTIKGDGEYLLKAVGSSDSGQEVWTGEGKITVANKSPGPIPSNPPTMTPVVRPPAPTMTPVPRPPLPTSVTVRPTASTPSATAPTSPSPTVGVTPGPWAAQLKPITVASKPVIKPIPKPVTPPVVVAQAPRKVVSPPTPVVAPPKTVTTRLAHPTVTMTTKPPVVAPKPASTVKPLQKHTAPPKIVAKPKPVVRVAPNPASVAWKSYTNSKYGFAAEYPGTAQVQNESSHMKPKGPGAFWIAFTQTSSGKPWYAINVRHMKTNELGTPDKFAKYNPYLLSWERTNVAGLDGFKTISGRASSKRVIHRTLLVGDRDVWMLNLTDLSGNDASITGEIFKRFVESFRPGGATGGGHPVPVSSAPPIRRTGYPTPPRRTTVETAPVPPPAPAPEAPPPPASDDSGYNSGE